MVYKKDLKAKLEKALLDLEQLDETSPILALVDEGEGYTEGFRQLSNIDFIPMKDSDTSNLLQIDIIFD